MFSGETFVTRKVTRSVAQIHLGYMESVSQGKMIKIFDYDHQYLAPWKS